METIEIHNCQNCKYFAAYYIKNFRAQFKKLGNQGYCLNSELQDRVSQKRIRCGIVCEFWQPAPQAKEERRQHIDKVLRDMSERLNEIALILKDDNQ